MKKEEEKPQQWQQGKRGSGTQNFTQKLNRDIFFSIAPSFHFNLRTTSLPAYLSKAQTP